MNVPCFNDPVTVVDDGLLVHARWGTPAPIAGRWLLARDTLAGRQPYGGAWLEDEGITWVRGHVRDTDPEGAALLTAAILRQQSTADWIDIVFGDQVRFMYTAITRKC